jgi:Fe-S oxidoreductase
MARMKIEVQAARLKKWPLSLHDRLVGYLPRYAPLAARYPSLFNLRNTSPALTRWSEKFAGFSTKRKLPAWRPDWFRDEGHSGAARRAEPGIHRESSGDARKMDSGQPLRGFRNDGGDVVDGPEVVLFADTFNRYFEPENIHAALTVLEAAGCRVHLPKPVDGSRRPLCCGRTFLSVGLVDQARAEAERTVAALAPFVELGVPVVGLEPSCILGFRDEIPALLKTEEARWVGSRAMLFEEFVTRDLDTDSLLLGPVGQRALLHGHCHQKSFGVMGPVENALKLVPGLAVETIESSCCGMAGAFGYGADTIDVSLKMGELSLLPAVRNAPADTIIVADGTSCRHQIGDGAGREALHVARVLAMSVSAAPPAGSSR